MSEIRLLKQTNVIRDVNEIMTEKTKQSRAVYTCTLFNYIYWNISHSPSFQKCRKNMNLWMFKYKMNTRNLATCLRAMAKSVDVPACIPMANFQLEKQSRQRKQKWRCNNIILINSVNVCTITCQCHLNWWYSLSLLEYQYN